MLVQQKPLATDQRQAGNRTSGLMGTLQSPSRWWVYVAFFFAVVGAKFILIRGWGTDLPFWDQWDAEGAVLLEPWAEGRLTASDLFRPHNEHRIVYTRLLALALTAVNGQWDARVETAVNALLHAGTLTLLVWFAARTLSRLRLMFLAIFLGATFALPFGWENTLAGFQSQFYFVLLFGLVHIGGSVLWPPDSNRWWVAQAAGLFGLFAMASGFLSSAVVVALLLLRCTSESRFPRRSEWLGLGVCIGLIFLGIALRVDVPGHATLRAPTVGVWLEALTSIAAWPTNFRPASAILVLPIAWAAVRAWKSRFRDPAATLAGALGLWWAVQIVLIAYGRGSDGQAQASRYFDTFAIGIVAGLLAWLHFSSCARAGDSRLRLIRRIGFTLWLVVAVAGLVQRTRHEWVNIIASLPAANAAREHNVRDFVRGALSTFAEKEAWLETPYPDHGRLEALLRSPSLRALLPASVRLPLVPQPVTSAGFDATPPPGTGELGRPVWSSFRRSSDEAHWSSSSLQTHFPLLRFYVTGDLAAPAGELMVVSASGDRLVLPANPRRVNWGAVAIEAPETEFKIQARSATGCWLAFAAPIELGWLSWAAGHVLKTGPTFLVVGLGLLGTALAVGGIRQHRLTIVALARDGFALLKPSRFRAALAELQPWSIAVVLAIGALLFARKPHALLNPQLWAEDGSVFLVENETMGWRAWYEPYAGYLHLIPRIVAMLARPADPSCIPAIYNCLCFLAWWGIAASFLSGRVLVPGKRWLALAIALVPQTGEVLFQLCNLHWATALLLVRQLVLRPAHKRREHVVDAVALVLCAFTGPFSVLLWPAYAWRTWQQRQRTSAWIEFGIISVASVCHVIASIVEPYPRPPSAPLDLVQVAAFVGQRTFGVIFFGWERAAALGRPTQLLLCLALLVTIAYVFVRARRVGEHAAVAWCAAALLLLLGPTLLRGGSNLWDQPHLGYGDRYLFLPRVLIFWIFAIAFRPREKASWIFMAALVWSVWITRASFTVPRPTDHRWREYAPLLLRPEPANIPILPDGWILQYPGRRPDR